MRHNSSPSSHRSMQKLKFPHVCNNQSSIPSIMIVCRELAQQFNVKNAASLSSRTGSTTCYARNPIFIIPITHAGKRFARNAVQQITFRTSKFFHHRFCSGCIEDTKSWYNGSLITCAAPCSDGEARPGGRRRSFVNLVFSWKRLETNREMAWKKNAVRIVGLSPEGVL